MPTPIAQMLPQIVSLNVESEPFSFFAQGTQILGWWDVVKATSLYPTQVAHIDQSYRLIVTLNDQNGTFDYQDHSAETEARAGFTEDGFGFGAERSWSSGKMIKKKWHFEFGGVNRSSTGDGDDKVGFQPVVYSFETSRIKTPLFTWLESHGWRHGSALGALFAR
ncbi:hypothetical protein WBG06_10570 [Nocardioides sp. CCNWLW239]|uniref:hypothetical protein n=1 Tax=Nocardioides sp. CCNWLW239 TaxID=3128902 RepID=UPI00301995D8